MREAGMSVLSTGKPSGLTRAAAPARQRDRAVGRRERPGSGAARHLRVVPDTARPEGTQTAPENGRLRGAPAVREAGPVQGAPAVREAGPVRGASAVPGPRQPGDARRPGDAVRRPA